MPSQTIHIPTDDYRQALERMDESQTVSSRFAELVSKGLEAEDNNAV